MRELIIALAEELYINEHDRNDNLDCETTAAWALEAASIFYEQVQAKFPTGE